MAPETPARPLGRSAEARALDGVLEGLQQGRGASVFVEGDPGIGKTTLLRWLAAEAVRLGVDVRSAGARELEQDRPFGLIADALGLRPGTSDPLLTPVVEMLAEASAPAPLVALAERPTARFAVVEAIVDVVERWAEEAPMLLVLEDLHRADPSSLLVVSRLLRRVGELPLAVVASARSAPRDAEVDQVADLVRAEDGVTIRLTALDDDAVNDLATETLGGRPGPNLRAKLRAAGGNPLFVVELVRALDGEGLVTRQGGEAEAGEAGMVPSLRLAILRGVAFLPRSTMEALRDAAVLGSPFRPVDLALVMRTRPTELAASLDPAVRSGFLVEAGEELAFRHDVVRDAIYEDIPLGVRQALHGEFAAALAEAGAPAARVAAHVVLSGESGEQQVAWLRGAAGEVVQASPGNAVELLRRAADIAGPGHPERGAILADLVVALVWSGSIGDAIEMAGSALGEVADPAAEGVLRLFLARALILEGRHADAIRYCDVSEADGFPGTVLAELHGEHALARFLLPDPMGSVDVADRAIRLGTEVDDRLAASQGVLVVGMNLWWRGRLLEAAELLTGSVRLAGEEAFRYGHHAAAAVILAEVDRLGEAAELLAQGRRGAERDRILWMVPTNLSFTSLVRFYAGEWDDALAEHEAATALGEELGAPLGSALSHAVAAQILVARDELDRARAEIEAGQALLASGSTPVGFSALIRARSLLWQAEGKVDEAFSSLLEVMMLPLALQLDAESRAHGPDVVRLAIAAGRPDDAIAVTEACERLATMSPVPTARGTALVCRGLLEDDPDMLLAAVAAYREGPRPIELALAEVDAAQSLVAGGRTDEAIPLLRHAEEAFEDAGATRRSWAVEALLRAAGVRRGGRGPRAKAKTGWDSVTTTEARVLTLVGDGLANADIARRLFISKRTVETHVSHLLRKLGASTRLELVALAARRAGSERQADRVPD
jgi:DNA-binding NarL/FixJ family response regulator